MKNLNNKAFSIIEYVVLIVIIISAYLVMKDFIQRGVFGSWQQVGQSFAYGRQYDSEKTIVCSFDEISNSWYDHNCFESLCQADCQGHDIISANSCEENIITNGSCQASSCSQLNK